MARNFKELRVKMDVDRRARVEDRVQGVLKTMPVVGAVFPEGEVLINQFEDLDAASPSTSLRK